MHARGAMWTCGCSSEALAQLAARQLSAAQGSPGRGSIRILSPAADPLARYWAKRNFAVTSEPPGELVSRNAERSFVFQKHAASRLHYDPRLELDGVLVSWAVPNGPSFDPTDKRMSIDVEDHPIAYGSVEGRVYKVQSHKAAAQRARSSVEMQMTHPMAEPRVRTRAPRLHVHSRLQSRGIQMARTVRTFVRDPRLRVRPPCGQALEAGNTSRKQSAHWLWSRAPWGPRSP